MGVGEVEDRSLQVRFELIAVVIAAEVLAPAAAVEGRSTSLCRCIFWPKGGRPHFLLAVTPYGKQFCFYSAAMARRRGTLVAPSGFVPGDGEENPA